MPYIKLADRARFQEPIQAVLDILKDTNDNAYVKGEYLGYFVHRVARRFLGTADYTSPSFNSTFFDAVKKKKLDNAADTISVALSRSDPMSAAGELNYSITAILWGFIGEAEGFNSANYGMRAYVTGIVQKIYSSLETVNHGNQKDATMAFRRHLVIRGVLHDVLLEMYRRVTSEYENVKLNENHDIWRLGKLLTEEESKKILAIPVKEV